MVESERDTAILADDLAGRRLVYGNSGGDSFRYEPGRVTIALAVAALLRRYPTAAAVRLLPPAGWRLTEGGEERPVGSGGTVEWVLIPGGPPTSCEQGLACVVVGADEQLGTLRHVVPLELRGQSQFDPERDILPFRNDASDLGHVEPRLDLFHRTYRSGGTLLPAAFFAGLYRDIVFLSPDADMRGGGGLCTGMARFALEQSLQPASAGAAQLVGEPRRARAMEEAQAWHGRQLADRALLAAARQFFKPSPAAAFYRFRDQLLATGRGEVAFDIGIARWETSPARWGAMLQRLVAEGHTIVPYAFRQTSEGYAEVSVYDPSYPDRADWPENVVRFDLLNDRYAYRGFGSLEPGDPTTVLAVPQRNFEGDETAYLASLANLAIHPELLREEWRENAGLRRGVAVVGGMLAAAFALRRRGCRVAGGGTALGGSCGVWWDGPPKSPATHKWVPGGGTFTGW